MQITLAFLFLLLLARVFIVCCLAKNAWNFSECHLSSSVVCEIFDPWWGTWTVDDTFLSVNRLQDVVDCAEVGDTVALKVSKTIRLEGGALVIKKNLVIKSAEVNAKTSMTCPPNDSLLLVENANVVLENIIIQDCPFQQRSELKSIVILKCDELEDENFMLTLLNVEFANSDKSRGLIGTDIERPKCFSVTEKDITHHNRGLTSTDLSSEVKIQNNMNAIASPFWEAGDSQLTNTSITLNVENQECSINHYFRERDGKCAKCEMHEYNFHPDTEICKDCPEICKDCTEIANCSEEYVLPLHGYWNSFPCSRHVQECINKDACLGMDSDRLNEIIAVSYPATCILSKEDIKKYQDAQCDHGYRDLLCGSCIDYHERNERHDCVPCPNQVLNIFSLIVATYLLLYSVWQEISASLESVNTRLRRLERPSQEEREANVDQAFLLSEVSEEYINKAQNAQKKFAIVLQIYTNFEQGLKAALSLNYDWSKSINQLINTLNWISENLSQAYTVSVECLLPATRGYPPSYWSNLVSVFAPFLIICVTSMYWLYDTFHQRKSWIHFVQRVILTALSIIYFYFYSLVRANWELLQSVRIFDGISLDDVDAFHRYWFSDTSVKLPLSNSGFFVFWIFILVCLFLFFYVIGLLIVFKVIKARNAYESQWVKKMFGVLIIGYRRERIYWDICILIRNCLLATTFVVVRNLTNPLRGTAIAAIFMGSLLLQFKNVPFLTEFGHLNFLEELSLLVCGVTAVMCTMLSNQIASSSNKRAILISIVTISSTIAYACFGYHLVVNKFIEIKYVSLYQGVVNRDDNAVIVILKYWRAKLRNGLESLRRIAKTFCPCFNH